MAFICQQDMMVHAEKGKAPVDDSTGLTTAAMGNDEADVAAKKMAKMNPQASKAAEAKRDWEAWCLAAAGFSKVLRLFPTIAHQARGARLAMLAPKDRATPKVHGMCKGHTSSGKDDEAIRSRRDLHPDPKQVTYYAHQKIDDTWVVEGLALQLLASAQVAPGGGRSGPP